MAQYKGAASEAGRAMQIKKRREREQEEMEQKKRKLEETLKINKIENKFAVHYDAVEQQLKVSDHLNESMYALIRLLRYLTHDLQCDERKEPNKHYLCPYVSLQSSTIGLVTLNEMKAKQEDVVKEREKELARKIREQEKLLKKEIEAKQAKKKEQREKVCWNDQCLLMFTIVKKKCKHQETMHLQDTAFV